MEQEDIFNGYGIQVKLKEDFTKIREVLTRIGIGNNKTKTLTQSCHIFHKRGQYALMHFKEMFLFDGKSADFTEDDEARRNRIFTILKEWGMIEEDEDLETDFPVAEHNSVMIISREQRSREKWNLVKKYSLGKRG